MGWLEDLQKRLGGKPVDPMAQSEAQIRAIDKQTSDMDAPYKVEDAEMELQLKGGDPSKVGKKKPALLDRAIGPWVAFGTSPMNEAFLFNAVRSQKRRGGPLGWAGIGGQDKPMAAAEKATGYQWYDPMLDWSTKSRSARTSAKAGYLDPHEELVKAAKGEKYVQGADVLREAGVKNKVGQAVGGFGLDVLTDWTTYKGNIIGMGGATKARYGTMLEKLAAEGVHVPGLIEMGVDIAKLSPDARKALEAGEGALKYLDPKDATIIRKAVAKKAGEAVAGTTREVGIPFLRKTKEGALGLKAVVPALGLKSADDIAMQNARMMGREALGDKTIARRLGSMSAKGQAAAYQKLGIRAPKITGKTLATKGLQQSDEALESVAIPLGKRGVDKGGFAGIGGQGTLIDMQDSVARTLRENLPKAEQVEALFNPNAALWYSKTPKGMEVYKYVDNAGEEIEDLMQAADMYRRGEAQRQLVATVHPTSTNNAVSVAAAKNALRQSLELENLYRNMATEAGVELGHEFDEGERHIIGLAIAKVQDPDLKAALMRLHTKSKKELKTAERVQGRLARLGVKNVDDPAQVAAAKGKIADQKLVYTRKNAAGEDVEIIVPEEIEKIDTQVADLGTLRERLGSQFGKTAETVERSAARLAGEAKGTGRAVSEADRAAALAGGEVARSEEAFGQAAGQYDALKTANEVEEPWARATEVTDWAPPVKNPELPAPPPGQFFEPSAAEIDEATGLPGIGNNTYSWREARFKAEEAADAEINAQIDEIKTQIDLGKRTKTGKYKPIIGSNGEVLYKGGDWSRDVRYSPKTIEKMKAQVAELEASRTARRAEVASQFDEAERRLDDLYNRMDPETGEYQEMIPASDPRHPANPDYQGPVGPPQTRRVDVVERQPLAEVAGVEPGTMRTPVTQTATGKARQFDTWQANVEESLVGTTENELTHTPKYKLSASGTRKGVTSVRMSADQLADHEPELVMDILEGRVAAALDAGDMEAARAYQAHVDDFMESLEAPPDELPSWLGESMFDDLREGRAPVQKRDIDLEAAAAYDPITRKKALIDRQNKMRARLDRAYREGRATGKAEQARQVGQDAIRWERQRAAAQGRAANYEEVISRLGSQEAQLSARAEILRGVERDQRQLLARRERLMKRMDSASARTDVVEGLVDKQAEARAQAALDDMAMQQFGPASIDYELARPFLREMGVTDERATEMLDAMEGKIQAQNEAIRQGELGMGLESTEKRGPYTASGGYEIGTDPAQPTLRDWFSGTSVGEMLGVKPSISTRIRQEMQEKATGVTPGQLSRRQGEAGALLPWTRRDKPNIAGLREAEYETALERIVRGKLETETDIAKLQAARINAGGQRISKAGREDFIVEHWGTELPANHGAVPEGMATMTLKRNGEDITYMVPAQIDKWQKGLDSVFLADESTNVALRALDAVQNTWKRLATTVNLGFHGRNLVSNYWLAWTDDMADLRGWEDAAEVMMGNADPAKLYKFGGIEQTAEEWKQAALALDVRKGVFGPAQVTQSVQQQLDATMGGGAWKKLNQIGGDLGTAIEDGSRMAVWFNAMEKGFTPEEAAREVSRVLYDYSATNLTAFERNVMKRVLPFYTWIRRNIPRMVEIYVTNPQKFVKMKQLRGNLLSASGVDPMEMPEYQNENFAMPIPGTDLMYGTPLPMNDLQRLDITEPGKTTRQWLSGISPVWKEGPELAGNTDLFTGRQIQEDTELSRATGFVQAFGDATGMAPPGTEWRFDPRTGEEYVASNPYVNKVIRDFFPAMNKYGMTVDNAPGGSDYGGLNALTGVKLSPIDREKWERQRNAERLAELQGATRVQTDRGY